MNKVHFFNGRAYAVGAGGLIMRSKILDPNSSTRKLAHNNEIKIYPNPSEGVSTLKLSAEMTFPMQITVLDARGEVVSQVTQNERTSEIAINTKTLAKGIYFIKAISGVNEFWTTPLMVQ